MNTIFHAIGACGSRFQLATVLAAVMMLAALPGLGHAWHDEGHVYSATAAVRSLPEEMPAFFREGARTIAHVSIDPDLAADRQQPQLRAVEGPEHYFDIEFLAGREIPETRYAMIALCHELELDPRRVGFLPYSISEWTQRLTIAFAEHRRDPDNEHVRMKCLIYAGLLAHYAADLHMPLHTTIHFDGRVTDDGSFPHTGIHAKVDALPTKLPYRAMFAEPLPEPAAHENLFPYVVAQLMLSHAQVDRTYELEAKLPAWNNIDELQDEELIEFTTQRMREAAHFTASLYRSAWERSANTTLPFWLDRKVFDEGWDETRIPEQPQEPARR